MMKKSIGILILLLYIALTGCSQIQPELQGTYQSDVVDGYVIQMAFQPDDNSFVEYIDNREVDKGTFVKKQADTYTLKGSQQNGEITLSKDNEFAVQVSQINTGKSIKVKNIDKVPTYFSKEFDDTDQYKALLNKKQDSK